MPLTEEQKKLTVKAVSCTVLLLDKRHYPMTPGEGFWQWINAAKLILVCIREVYCIRCDWLRILQNISRWATDASEFRFRKVLTNLTKDDSSRTVQASWIYKTGLRGEHFSCDSGFKVLWALPVIPYRHIRANVSLWVMVTSSHESRAVRMRCRWSQWAKPLQPCFHEWWYQLD